MCGREKVLTFSMQQVVHCSWNWNTHCRWNGRGTSHRAATSVTITTITSTTTTTTAATAGSARAAADTYTMLAAPHIIATTYNLRRCSIPHAITCTVYVHRYSYQELHQTGSWTHVFDFDMSSGQLVIYSKLQPYMKSMSISCSWTLRVK